MTTLTPHGFIGAQKFPLLRVVLGPQDEMFTEKGLFDFKSALYTVTQDSNRMAAKLNGAAIEARAGVDILSDGIVEGSVQICANGQPIVMLTDHQSTGGYAQNRDGHSVRHSHAGTGSPRPARRLPRRDGGRGYSRLQKRKR